MCDILSFYILFGFRFTLMHWKSTVSKTNVKVITGRQEAAGYLILYSLRNKINSVEYVMKELSTFLFHFYFALKGNPTVMNT